MRRSPVFRVFDADGPDLPLTIRTAFIYLSPDRCPRKDSCWPWPRSSRPAAPHPIRGRRCDIGRILPSNRVPGFRDPPAHARGMQGIPEAAAGGRVRFPGRGGLQPEPGGLRSRRYAFQHPGCLHPPGRPIRYPGGERPGEDGALQSAPVHAGMLARTRLHAHDQGKGEAGAL